MSMVLNNPMSMVNPVKRLSCQQCYFKAVDSQELSSHMINVHQVQHLGQLLPESPSVNPFKKVLNFNCKRCDFVAGSQSEIIQHFKQLHMGKKVQASASRCDRCHFTAVDRSQFDVHIKMCQQNYANQQNPLVQSHQNSPILDLVRPNHTGYIQNCSSNESSTLIVHSCPYCDFQTTRAANFESHMTNPDAHRTPMKLNQQQLTSSENIVPQAESDKVRNTIHGQLLKNQFPSFNNNVMSSFNRKEKSEKEAKINKIQPAKYYKKAINCAHCKFQTKSEKTFKMHMYRLHSAMMPKSDKVNKPKVDNSNDDFYTYFRCTLCHYKSLLADNLTDHMSKKHSGNEQLQTVNTGAQNGYLNKQDMTNQIPELTIPKSETNGSDIVLKTESVQETEPDEMVCSKCFYYSSSNITEMALHFMSCIQINVHDKMILRPEVSQEETPVLVPVSVNQDNLNQRPEVANQDIAFQETSHSANQDNINQRPAHQDMPVEENTGLAKNKRSLQCTKCFTFSTKLMWELPIHFKHCTGKMVDRAVEEPLQTPFQNVKEENITISFNNEHSRASSDVDKSKPQRQKLLLCAKCHNFNTIKYMELAMHYKICNPIPNKQEPSTKPQQHNSGLNFDSNSTEQDISSPKEQLDESNVPQKDNSFLGSSDPTQNENSVQIEQDPSNLPLNENSLPNEQVPCNSTQNDNSFSNEQGSTNPPHIENSALNEQWQSNLAEQENPDSNEQESDSYLSLQHNSGPNKQQIESNLPQKDSYSPKKQVPSNLPKQENPMSNEQQVESNSPQKDSYGPKKQVPSDLPEQVNSMSDEEQADRYLTLQHNFGPNEQQFESASPPKDCLKLNEEQVERNLPPKENQSENERGSSNVCEQTCFVSKEEHCDSNLPQEEIESLSNERPSISLKRESSPKHDNPIPNEQLAIYFSPKHEISSPEEQCAKSNSLEQDHFVPNEQEPSDSPSQDNPDQIEHKDERNSSPKLNSDPNEWGQSGSPQKDNSVATEPDSSVELQADSKAVEQTTSMSEPELTKEFKIESVASSTKIITCSKCTRFSSTKRKEVALHYMICIFQQSPNNGKVESECNNPAVTKAQEHVEENARENLEHCNNVGDMTNVNIENAIPVATKSTEKNEESKSEAEE